MNLWITALAALALLPLVRLFMADGCGSSPPPPPPPATHGTSPLRVSVFASSAIPNSAGQSQVRITGGSVRITPPSASAAFSLTIPPGGLASRSVSVTDAMFAGTPSPWQWHAVAMVQYENGDPGRPPAGELSSRELTWTWDANSNHPISFSLRIRADERGGVVTITELNWEVLAGG